PGPPGPADQRVGQPGVQTATKGHGRAAIPRNTSRPRSAKSHRRRGGAGAAPADGATAAEDRNRERDGAAQGEDRSGRDPEQAGETGRRGRTPGTAGEAGEDERGTGDGEGGTGEVERRREAERGGETARVGTRDPLDRAENPGSLLDRGP